LTDQRAGGMLASMTRLRDLRKEELDPEQRGVWDLVCDLRGREVTNAGGGLDGPYNAMVYMPKVGGYLAQFAHAVNVDSSLSLSTKEIAVLTIGAHWKCEFHWVAHVPRARAGGLPESAIEALAAGRVPELDDAGERAAYAVARQIVETGRLDDDVYDAAARALGDVGVVELLSLCGCYTVLAWLIDGFAVELPPGATPWLVPPR
jgi:4-carboxymuconolactone decarboxylase